MSARSPYPPATLNAAWATFNGYWVFCSRQADGTPKPVVAVFRGPEMKRVRDPQTGAKVSIQAQPAGWETLPDIESIPAPATRARLAQEWASVVAWDNANRQAAAEQEAQDFAGAKAVQP